MPAVPILSLNEKNPRYSTVTSGKTAAEFAYFAWCALVALRTTQQVSQVLLLGERGLASSTPDGAENGGIQLHLAITEATHNSMQVEPFYQSREWRENNSMWIQLY